MGNKQSLMKNPMHLFEDLLLHKIGNLDVTKDEAAQK